MRRLVGGLMMAVAIVSGATGPVQAARNPGARTHTVDWKQHDTAVYVVTTLNLLKTRHGHSPAWTFQHRLHARYYDVYADGSPVVRDLYFIDVVRANHTVAAVFAYRLGWQKPVAVTKSHAASLARHASFTVVDAYHTDPRVLIGQFTSTIPQ